MILLLLLIICAALGYAVAGKNKKGLGLILGLILGPLGVLIAAVACRE